MHVALRFAYDGAAFPNGYARQPEGGTVEDALIAACRKEGYADGSWATGSRTDKGVSAAENVAVVKLDRPHLTGLVPALQSGLPKGLWMLGAAEVSRDWNPRHHAVREYLYVSPRGTEELDAMQRAAERFVGTHDMSGFARVEPPRNPERIIDACRVDARDDAWHFHVASEGFLWNQVRRMVDAILLVGSGKATVADIDAALASGRPMNGSGLAPAEGLLLRRVTYAPEPEWSADAGSFEPGLLQANKQRHAVEGALFDALA